MRLTPIAAISCLACAAMACGIDALGSMPVDGAEPATPAEPDARDSSAPPGDDDATADASLADADAGGDAALGDAVADAALDVAPDAPLGALLEVTSIVSPANVDLTAEGTLEWAYWGVGGSTTSKRKVGTTTISALTAPGDADGTSSGFGTTFSWTDATDGAGSSSGYFYVTGGVGTGESFTVPAGPTKRTVVVWVGGNQIRGKLTATLGAGTGSLIVKSDASHQSQSSTFAAQYTVDFRALTLTQLEVKWEIDQTYGVDSARFTAVALR